MQFEKQIFIKLFLLKLSFFYSVLFKTIKYPIFRYWNKCNHCYISYISSKQLHDNYTFVFFFTFKLFSLDFDCKAYCKWTDHHLQVHEATSSLSWNYTMILRFCMDTSARVFLFLFLFLFLFFFVCLFVFFLLLLDVFCVLDKTRQKNKSIAKMEGWLNKLFLNTLNISFITPRNKLIYHRE